MSNIIGNSKRKQNISFLNSEQNIKEKEKNDNLIPNDLYFLHNIPKSYSYWGMCNTFTIFKSNNISYIIFATIKKSIICYNFNTEKIIMEIKNAHNGFITGFRHYHKKSNNKDFIMSISGEKKNIKIWDAFIWNCILDLTYKYPYGLLFSSCFFNDGKNDYIIICTHLDNSPINVYDFSGKLCKEIKDSKDDCFFIDYFYEKKKSVYYIINGSKGNVKSYNYNENKLYHIYSDYDDSWHSSVKIILNNNILKLIDSCWDNDFIRIYNFHSGNLLSKIKTNGESIRSIYAWNNNYLFVGCSDHKIKLIDVNKEKVVKNYEGHEHWVCTINKIIHPKYGQCLVSQGLGEKEFIKIWKMEN